MKSLKNQLFILVLSMTNAIYCQTFVPDTRTLTINGVSQDLTVDRTWSVGDLLSTGSYSNPSWLTSLAWSKITGVPDASTSQSGIVTYTGSQSFAGTKTFTADITLSGTGTELLLPKGTETNPSLTCSLYPTNGWSFKSSQIVMSFASYYHFGFDNEGKFGTSNIPSELLLKLDLNVYHDASLDTGSPQDGGLNVTTYGTDADLKTATFTGRTASGTFASPHATAQDQAMAEFTGKGNCGVGCSGADNKGFEPSNRGVYGVYASLAHTSLSQPAYCAIQTTKIDEILDHYSFLVDHAGNAGLVYKTTSGPVFNTSTPYGWDTGMGYRNRFFSIESETNTSDAGLFIQNGGSTGGGAAGVNLWFDNSADVVYFDNIKSSSSLSIRTNTAAGASSTTNLTINTSGTNIGTDATPNNTFTVGATSQFQMDNNGKIVQYTTAIANGELLIGKTTGSTFEKATLTGGSGVSIDNTVGGAITINAVPGAIIGGGGGNNSIAASTTAFAPIISTSSFASSTNEADRQFVMPYGGTIKNLYVYISNSQPATGNYVFTIRKNGTNTSLVVTIAANSPSGFYFDTTDAHKFTFSAGDLISVQAVNSATGNSAKLISWSVQITQ